MDGVLGVVGEVRRLLLVLLLKVECVVLRVALVWVEVGVVVVVLCSSKRLLLVMVREAVLCVHAIAVLLM